MTFRSIALAAALGLAAIQPAPAAETDALKGQTITPAFSQAIPNIPGKTLTGVLVQYEPGATTPSHRHAKSAFIMAYVVSGAIKSQVDDGPAKVYRAGESWSEQPGAHHRVSENASATEPASLLAIFVVDTNDTELTTLDKK